MKELIKSNKLKLALGAILCASIVAICIAIVAPHFAVAADEEVAADGDRIVNLEVYNGSYGKIEIDGAETGVITIPASESSDLYTLNWAPVSNEAEDVTQTLEFICGGFKKDITVTFFEGKSSGICFLDVYGNVHYPGIEPYSFAALDVEGNDTNYFDLSFYGEEVFAGYVYGTPESKHSCFSLTVTSSLFYPVYLTDTISLKTLMEDFLERPWGYDEFPEYLFEIISADASIVSDRPYNIDMDGTLHVAISIAGLENIATLNAKAIGNDGAVFKNWILNGEVIPNGSSGITPDPALIDEGLYGYELVAQYYDIDMCQVTFDSQGGSEVAAQVVEKGATITKPSDPTKDGYAFDGWYTTSECTGAQFDFTTPINASMTLYAKWVELPKIIDGEGSVWYFGSLEDLAFTTTAKYDDIVAVAVDDGQVDTSAYTVESKDGNTVVSLKSEYLTLMKDGEHHIGIVSNVVLSAGTELYVTYASFTTTVYVPVPDPSNPTVGPQTGDYILWIAVLSVIGAVIGFGSMKLRRKRINS